MRYAIGLLVFVLFSSLVPNPITIVFHLSPVLAQEETQEQPFVSNVFYDTDLRQAVADVAAQAGVSIIMDETVQGLITVEILDLPLEEALQRMLSPLGFTFKRMKGYYVVGSAYPDSPSFSLLSVTERISLNYLRAKDVPSLLSAFYGPFLRVNDENNTLVVTASPEILAGIKEDLLEIDVPPRQLMIEALVTEMSNDARKSLGFDVNWFSGKGGKAWDVIIPLEDLLSDSLSLYSGSVGMAYSDPDASMGGWRGDFRGAFKALVEDGEVNIRANPRVATLEGQKATIIVGKEQYYVIVTGTGQYAYGQLERIPVGVSLVIAPYISGKGEITVDIQPEVSDVVGTGVTGLPVVSKRAVSTKIRVKDGETIVIGGLIQKNESVSKRKIPLLGDIPILGLLFSRTEKRVDEVETVVFITPHILTDGETVSDTGE